MKSLILNISILLVSLTLFTACNSGETKQTDQKATQQTETTQEVAGVNYTCPMHPEVTSLEPGKCPKCGMNLEKPSTENHEHEAGDQH